MLYQCSLCMLLSLLFYGMACTCKNLVSYISHASPSSLQNGAKNTIVEARNGWRAQVGPTYQYKNQDTADYNART